LEKEKCLNTYYSELFLDGFNCNKLFKNEVNLMTKKKAENTSKDSKQERFEFNMTALVGVIAIIALVFIHMSMGSVRVAPGTTEYSTDKISG